jgi:hypothetical protein
MGVRASFDSVRSLVVAAVPTITMELTAEAKEFHGVPPRVIWYLPEPGQEQFELANVGPGSRPTDAHQGVIVARRVTCQIHCWMAGTLDARNVEVVDDNEDPAVGAVWLPGIVMSCMRAALTNVKFGRGGFLERSMGNLGFAYVFEIELAYPVYRLKTETAVLLESAAITNRGVTIT